MNYATLPTFEEREQRRNGTVGEGELGLRGPRPDVDPSLAKGGDAGDGIDGHVSGDEAEAENCFVTEWG